MAPHIILILSGKGGVGKSSTTTQLALSLSLTGKNVGVLDVDLTGPNMPRFFGVETSRVTQSSAGLLPVQVQTAHTSPSADGSTSTHLGSIHVMSLGFILSSRDSAVVWRGPKKTAMVRQFLTQTAWPPELDYLLVDTPPGTSDEHIALLETLLAPTTNLGSLAGAVVVTTPQAVAVSDVRKELSFCRKTETKVLGVLENMAGFVCPHCAECTNIFSKGGGAVMAAEFSVPFLGSIPLDPAFGALIEEGSKPEYPEGTPLENTICLSGDGLAEKYTSCALWGSYDKIVSSLIQTIESG